jgi:hypothetical protein
MLELNSHTIILIKDIPTFSQYRASQGAESVYPYNIKVTHVTFGMTRWLDFVKPIM